MRSIVQISPGFFAALGVPITAGRDFSELDAKDKETVAIISETLAQRMFTIASDMPTFGTNSATQVAKHVVQRPDHESLFFSLLLQFTSGSGDLGSSRLDNVVRRRHG